MKVNFKNIFVAMALVAGLGFASCSSDSDNYTPSDDADVQLPMAPEVDLPMAPDFDKEPQN
nr:hypothetical protein [uncultured Carboxylicivirga sp.]